MFDIHISTQHCQATVVIKCLHSNHVYRGIQVFLGSRDPLQKFISEAKRMMYWYKNTKMYYFLTYEIYLPRVAPTTYPTPYLV